MPKLSLIIPVYNEKNTILEILAKVGRVDLGETAKEVIIVDDFSSDGTREILQSLAGQYQIIFHDQNYGKGLAIRSALKKVSGDWTVIQDADLEYEPEDLKKLLNKIQEPGVAAVYGSRRLNRSYFSERHSGFVYAMGGIFLTGLANLLYGVNITDEANCYKMVKTDLLRSLDLKCRRFEFCPEVTAKLGKRKIKIHELPVRYNPRHNAEGKKIGWRDGLAAVWTLIKHRFIK